MQYTLPARSEFENDFHLVAENRHSKRCRYHHTYDAYRLSNSGSQFGDKHAVSAWKAERKPYTERQPREQRR
jgi:hypothetical protein